MARSVGEAVATGLESGLNLGMGIVNQRRQQDRQDTLDAQHNEDRQRAIQRQQMADQGAALDAQLKDLNSEGQAMEASPTPPPQDVMQDYAQRVSTVKAARAAHLAKVSGVVVQDAHQGAKDDLKALDTGDLSKVKNLARAVTVGTGQDPKVFLRPQGGPAPIEQAGADFMEGMQTGDKAKMVGGANLIFGPKLQEGIGQPSPHGGTIVRKEIVDIVPDPNAPEKDPRYIPVLKVYVKKDNFNGPGDPDKGGATSAYTAPLTEGRATGADAKVKSLRPKDVMDFVGHNLHVVELLNQPDGLEKLQQDQQTTPFNPQEYLTALQQAGVQPAKATVKETVIPAGGTLVRTTTDKQGRVLSEKTIQGNAKVAAPDKITLFSDGIDKQVDQGVLSEEEGAQMKRDFATRLASGSGDATMQAKLRAIDEDASLSDAEKATQRKAVLSGIKPSTTKGGATATDKADMAVMGRRLQVLKDQRLSLENDRKTALEEFKLVSHDGSKKEIAAAKAIYDTRVAALEGKGKDLETRIAKISDELDNREVKAAKAEDGLSSDAPEGTLAAGRKVAPADQAARDKDRVGILTKEVKDTQARLDKAKQGGDADTIKRAQGDLDAVSRELKKAGGTVAATPGTKAPAGTPAKPSSKAEYDALPSGAVYERDGKTYRKK